MYSQNDEEQYILAALGDRGRFLDVGAWNATDKSNTRALYERGWSGVMIEPSPGPFRGLEAAYPPGNGVLLINAAVVIEPGTVEMWLTDDACSTSDPETYRKWRGIVAYEPQKVRVVGVTVEKLLTAGGFDFVSIDAEGQSVPILFRLMDLGERPKCICVEHDYRQCKIMARMGPLGYVRAYESGENIVLVKT